MDGHQPIQFLLIRQSHHQRWIVFYHFIANGVVKETSSWAKSRLTNKVEKLGVANGLKVKAKFMSFFFYFASVDVWYVVHHLIRAYLRSMPGSLAIPLGIGCNTLWSHKWRSASSAWALQHTQTLRANPLRPLLNPKANNVFVHCIYRAPLLSRFVCQWLWLPPFSLTDLRCHYGLCRSIP